MEQPVLMLSSTNAAAHLAIALWSGQFFAAALRPRNMLLAWHAILVLLTLLTSTYLWQAPTRVSGWSTAWMISGLLAAVGLVICLGRWLRRGNTPVTHDSPLIPMTLAAVGVALGVATLIQSHDAHDAVSPLLRWASHLELLSVACLSGVLLAASIELTGGALGSELLSLPWQRLSLCGGIAFLVQICLGLVVVTRLQAGESPLETIAPVVYSFGMVLLSYIAWCVPRRMLNLAKHQQVTGQASLALSGWIGILCFALAGALPLHWPWNLLGG